MTTVQDGVTASRYGALEGDRNTALDRAREAARLTIPMLVPPAGHGNHTRYPTPYQSMGARGVNTLASKLVLILFPPNFPFLRLVLTDKVLAEMGADKKKRAAIELGLAKVERMVMQEIETSRMRPKLTEALKQLLVAGNVLLYIPPKGSPRLYRLDSYVVKRDPSGNILEIIAVDRISPMEITGKTLELVNTTGKFQEAQKDPKKTLSLFTHVKRTEDGFTAIQELCGVELGHTLETYPKDRMPWLAARWVAIDNEDYGRSFIEENVLGDLASLEALSRALVKGALALSKVLFGMRPGATARPKDLSKKETGQFFTGSEGDVWALTSGQKASDLNVADTMRTSLTESLSYSFMLMSAIQRQGERVTAEEIRRLADDIEAGLGGNLPTQSMELQYPIGILMLERLTESGQLPELPKGTFRPQVSTGVDALGRGNDREKLVGYLTDVVTVLPEFAPKLNQLEAARRLAASHGIDATGLIPTDEEVAEQDQQAQVAGLVETLGPEALKQAGGMAQQQMQQSQGNPEAAAPAEAPPA